MFIIRASLGRRLLGIVGAVCVAGLASCSFHPQQTVLPPVGPSPPAASSPEQNGYLLVYSAWSNFVDQGSTGHHSRYTIKSNDGKTSREVINHFDRFDEGPIRLSLAPGAYHIRARSARFGKVTVPVVIRPHQTTYVYLDGRTHKQAPAPEEADAVRLPDGEVVGWSTTIAVSDHEAP